MSNDQEVQEVKEEIQQERRLLTMANSAMQPSDVKAVCDKLECSPSQHQSTSNYGGKAKIIHHSGSDASGSVSGKLTPGGKRKK